MLLGNGKNISRGKPVIVVGTISTNRTETDLLREQLFIKNKKFNK
jgi:hypothetical protein